MSRPVVKRGKYYSNAKLVLLDEIDLPTNDDFDRAVSDFAVIIEDYKIDDVIPINGAHLDRIEEVRTLVQALLDTHHTRQGVVLMSFGEVYLLYGLQVMQKLGYEVDGFTPGTIDTILPGPRQQPWSYDYFILNKH